MELEQSSFCLLDSKTVSKASIAITSQNRRSSLSSQDLAALEKDYEEVGIETAEGRPAEPEDRFLGLVDVWLFSPNIFLSTFRSRIFLLGICLPFPSAPGL